MQIGWVDFSKTERDKVVSILRLLGTQTALDELGIGTVRDAFSDMLFPGISTLQTRAKYFVILPYLFAQAENHRFKHRRDVLAYIHNEEFTLVKTLVKNSGPEAYGIVGSRNMEKMVKIQRHLPEDERAEKVIFVITTDGLENASKRFSYEKIRRMIEREKEQYGWEFLFLGANMDAVKEAARFGIGADRAVRFENDAQGVAVNYHVVSETVSRMREAPCCASIGAEWKEQIEADFQKRHHR